MPATLSPTPFAAFEHLSRGDAAPDWLATGIVDLWGLPADAEIALIAVSENATFRVRLEQRDSFVVRVHRPGHVEDSRQIAGELSWMAALGEAGVVDVPEVLACRSGDLVGYVEDPRSARWYCVGFGFVSGRVLEEVEDPRPYYRQIGAAAARMHEQSVRWSLPDDASRFDWALTDMLGPTSRWGDWRNARLTATEASILEAAEAAARAELVSLPRPGEAGWGLIHADLRPSNIIIDGDSLTVIDFDDCGFGWLLYDFAAALSFIEHEPYAPDIARLWVAGYRDVRPLSPRDLVHANALSMVRRLTMLGWTTTHREDALPPELWASQIPGTVAVAQRYLASRTWLFDEDEPLSR